MSKISDGGPAFPFTPAPQPQLRDGRWDQNYDPGDSGMTLRDWFAGMALAGEMAQPDDSTYRTPNALTLEQWRAQHDKSMADYCYRMADALLAARETTQ